MLYFFRYVSLFFASIVFLAGNHDPPLGYKLLIVCALFAGMKGMTRVYQRCRKGTPSFRRAAAWETSITIVLILLTGGIDSPFLWCLLNPMLIAASYLSASFCWSLLLGCLVVVTSYSYLTYYSAFSDLSGMLMANKRDYLQLLLMALTVQVLSSVKTELVRSNARTQETMEHIKSLYQIVEAATHSESGNMGEVFAEFALKLTKLDMAFFLDCGERPEGERMFVRGMRDSVKEQALREELERTMAKIRHQDSATLVNLYGHSMFLIVPVKSPARFMGVMGIQIDDWNLAEGRRWFAQQLYFLSELCAIILERHELEKLENQLMIVEEQNRIADEMHDSVSQHLFAIAYAIHSLNEKWQSLEAGQLKEQLELIRASSTTASRELRSTICSLSSRKKAGAFWVATVRSYLDNLAKLSEIDIVFRVSGNEFRLPVEYQKSLYRMITESVGNAIRHGMSSLVEIELALEEERAKLAINDNGVGFNVVKKLNGQGDRGLGVSNIQFLVKSLGGTVRIDSEPGQGTRVVVTLPLVPADAERPAGDPQAAEAAGSR